MTQRRLTALFVGFGCIAALGLAAGCGDKGDATETASPAASVDTMSASPAASGGAMSASPAAGSKMGSPAAPPGPGKK